jgi:hypothetical protein
LLFGRDRQENTFDESGERGTRCELQRSGNASLVPFRLKTKHNPNQIPVGNRAPVMTAIADRFIHLGETLWFMADVMDPDIPPRTLSFSFDGTLPMFATLTLAGAFSWTPAASQAPSTNAITWRVTDNGDPPLSDSQTFTVVVAGQPIVAGLNLHNMENWIGAQLRTWDGRLASADCPVRRLRWSMAGNPFSIFLPGSF